MRNTSQALYEAIKAMPVVDAHTHIQDDVPHFSLTNNNGLSGTQAAFQQVPDTVLAHATQQGNLIRRSMYDATHGLSYTWFLQLALGSRHNDQEIFAALAGTDEDQRRYAGRLLLTELHDARFSEAYGWIEQMFQLYMPHADIDVMDPHNYDQVYEAVATGRHNAATIDGFLTDHHIASYVTSVENRAHLAQPPLTEAPDRCANKTVYNMFDAMYLLWPEGATDFGHYLSGGKYETEQWLLNIEIMLGITIDNAAALKQSISDLLRRILWSPVSNPNSRIRYTDIFLPLNRPLHRSYDRCQVDAAIRYHKAHLTGTHLQQLLAFSATIFLETLDDIGKEIHNAGHRYGSTLQIALGVDYFMDSSREVLSFPTYRSGMPEEAFACWQAHEHIHFEYIISHPQLYRDFAHAAKQVPNVSVGPWWHGFRSDSIANLVYEQLQSAPLSSIGSGFTDARFVEMLVAKYHSVRKGLCTAFARVLDDPWSRWYKQEDAAIIAINDLLYKLPKEKYHLE